MNAKMHTGLCLGLTILTALSTACTAGADDGASIVEQEYATSGSLDTTYGQGGTANLKPAAQAAQVKALIETADGGQLVLLDIWGPPRRTCAMRLDAKGQVVSTFGDQGSVCLDGSYDRARELPDGRLFLTSGLRHARLTSDGAFDASFGPGGTKAIPASVLGWPSEDASWGSVAAVVFDAGGGMYVEIVDHVQRHTRILHLDGEAEHDAAFGGGEGYVELEPEVGSWGHLVMLGGKLYVSTTGASFSGVKGVVIHRYDAQGTLDTSFGDRGAVRVDDTSHESQMLMPFGPDRLALALGARTWNRVLVLDPEGAPEPTFEEGGVEIRARGSRGLFSDESRPELVGYDDTGDGGLVRVDPRGLDEPFAQAVRRQRVLDRYYAPVVASGARGIYAAWIELESGSRVLRIRKLVR